ncbi:MAG: helicase associated domain-containing protein [Alphaproteobacteria bacterium]|nr:helicase associated domain-containing protein [Alphaproteobacteria bacterium]
MSKHDDWLVSYNELKDYYERKGELPSSKENKKLYNWYNRYVNAYKNGKLSKEKYDLLKGFIELKTGNFEKLRFFIYKNNRMPNKRSECKEERSLINWLYSLKKSSDRTLIRKVRNLSHITNMFFTGMKIQDYLPSYEKLLDEMILNYKKRKKFDEKDALMIFNFLSIEMNSKNSKGVLKDRLEKMKKDFFEFYVLVKK